MKGSKPVPHFESMLGVSVCRLVPNHIQVSFANGRQDPIKGSLDVGTGTQGAREGFCTALGVSYNGKAHFGKSRLKLALSQKKIAVSPRGLSGKWINLLGAQKSVARSNEVAFRFVNRGKIQPGFRRCWIQRQGNKVGVNGARGIGIIEIVLPIAAKEIPVLRVRGFEVHGALITFGGLQISVMGGERISDAEVGED